MRKIVILVIFLSTYLVKAQSDTVNYELISNNINYSYFGAGFSYDLGIMGYNMSLATLGLNAKYYNPLFSVDVRTRYHFFDGEELAFGKNPEALSIYKAEPSRDLTLNFNYFFKNDNKMNDVGITLGQVGNTTYITYVKAKSSLRYGLDVGLRLGTTFYNFNDHLFVYSDTGGVSYEVNSPVMSYFDYSVMNLGINKTEVEGLKIKTDKFGTKSTYSIVKKYIQFLFLVNSNVDDVYLRNEAFNGVPEHYVRLSINDVERSLLGVRLGYEYYVVGDKLDVGWAIETGLDPGPKVRLGNRFMLNFKIIFNIGKVF
jgi:hypothetical protein